MPSSVNVERLFRSSTTLHRSTQELSIQAAELDSALARDGSARFQQALADQQRVRIGSVIALAVATTLIRGGNLVAIAIAAGMSGLYLALVLRATTVAGHPNPSQRFITALLAVSDAVVATALCAAAAWGGAVDTLFWVLIAGSVAAPAMAFAFGAAAGALSLVFFAVGYITTALLFIGLHFAGVSATTSVATVALWGIGLWLTTRHFSDLRERLDWLRAYAKLAEVGDVGTAEMISTSDGSDDFALLARSFEIVHSRLYEQIGSDPLTGCANRRGLEKQLLGVCRLARRREGIVAVAALDIDHFKEINDTYGHPEGDRVLRQLATIMLNTVRESDTVARLGGDEFVIILPDSDLRGTRVFAERLRQRVRDSTFGPPGGGISITISIGVSVGEGKAQLEPDRLLAYADEALYDAKAGGRDRVATVAAVAVAAGAPPATKSPAV
jgi:diguanylate cyclase (GGDEF)-like protein